MTADRKEDADFAGVDAKVCPIKQNIWTFTLIQMALACGSLRPIESLYHCCVDLLRTCKNQSHFVVPQRVPWGMVWCIGLDAMLPAIFAA